MKNKMKIRLILLLLALVVLSGCKAGEAAQVPAQSGELQNAYIDVDFENYEGDIVKLSEFAGNGKCVVMNFWSSWNEESWKELPIMQAASESHKDDATFLMIHQADAYSTTKEQAKNYLRDSNLAFDHVLYDAGAYAASLYETQRVSPSTIVIDAKGQVVAGYAGALDEEKLEELIQKGLE